MNNGKSSETAQVIGCVSMFGITAAVIVILFWICAGVYTR